MLLLGGLLLSDYFVIFKQYIIYFNKIIFICISYATEKTSLICCNLYQDCKYFKTQLLETF